MLLELDESVFVSQQGKDIWMTALIVQFTVEKRHDWFLSPELVEAAASYLVTYAPAIRNWNEYVMGAAKASAWHASDSRTPLKVTGTNLEPLASDLAKPAVLVVENSRNDGSFLRAVFAAYSPELHQALIEDWLHIDHGGGGDQKYVAEQVAAKFKSVCRVVVVKDNDKFVDTMSDERQQGEWPPSQPVSHMWWRHEVENYLPDAVLELCKHPNIDEMLWQLRQMTPEQQRWIDMKNGVNNHKKTELFKDLDQKSRQLWNNGLKGKFPKPLVPEEMMLTVEDFRSLGEDVERELRILLGKIRQLV